MAIASVRTLSRARPSAWRELGQNPFLLVNRPGQPSHNGAAPTGLLSQSGRRCQLALRGRGRLVAQPKAPRPEAPRPTTGGLLAVRRIE